MTHPLSCAVMVYENENAAAVSASIHAAKAHAMGPFERIDECRLANDPSPATRHNAALAAAQALNATWILFIGPGETLRADAFERAAPPLRVYDAIWGAVSLMDGPTEVQAVVRKSRLACQTFAEFFHLALRWWIGQSHFIKTDLAQACAPKAHVGPWYMAYLIALWRDHACLKTAQPLTATQQDLGPLDADDEAYLLHHLDRHAIFRTVHSGAKPIQLPYTGRNPVIEREQTRGLFYEQDELQYLVSRIAPGGVIVDVGANTGNHTVYFALFGAPRKVIPIEPIPHAITALKRAVEANDLNTVELDKLGVGAGRERGRFRLHSSSSGGLGANRLSADPTGEVRVLPLDELIDEPVDFIKIDVESMEMSVLEGAQRLIADHRPQIFIEIADLNSAAFLTWIDNNAYRIDKIFPDKSHANYFLSPLSGGLHG